MKTVGWELVVETSEALEERDSLEACLLTTDYGRVLCENFGIFFAYNVSNPTQGGVE